MTDEIVELSRIMRSADRWARYFRYYDALLETGMSEAEATAIIEAAQADERNERRAA